MKGLPLVIAIAVYVALWMWVEIISLLGARQIEYKGPYSRQEMWLHQRYPLLWSEPEEADPLDLLFSMFFTPFAEALLISRHLWRKCRRSIPENVDKQEGW